MPSIASGAAMNASFQITGLPHDVFAPWFELSDPALAARGAVRCWADANPGYYCRVSLEDAEIGEEVLLLAFEHHRAESPYRSAGPIFVRRSATQQRLAPDTLPLYVTRRLNSVRAYDAAGTMVDAGVHTGIELQSVIERLFADSKVAYLHLHDAKRGCFSCQVDRC
jgi:Protein of unknown function (DUF1203)